LKYIYIKHRLTLLFKSKRKAINYYKTLPPEIRWSLVSQGIVGYPWTSYYGIRRNIKEIYNLFLDCVSESHRIKRDWWNLDSSISYFILPRLRLLRKCHNGYSDDVEPYDRNEKDSEEAKNKSWELVLDDMIFAFEYNFILNLKSSGDSLLSNKNHALYEIYNDMAIRKERGMKYFIKYFDNLWD
jgi:hypothetical protein